MNSSTTSLPAYDSLRKPDVVKTSDKSSPSITVTPKGPSRTYLVDYLEVNTSKASSTPSTTLPTVTYSSDDSYTSSVSYQASRCTDDQLQGMMFFFVFIFFFILISFFLVGASQEGIGLTTTDKVWFAVGSFLMVVCIVLSAVAWNALTANARKRDAEKKAKLNLKAKTNAISHSTQTNSNSTTNSTSAKKN